MDSPADSRRQLPSVDRLLQTPQAKAALQEFSRDRVVEACRNVLEALRTGGLAASGAAIPSEERLAGAAVARLAAEARPSYRRVVNATGVGLHTNLGRAVLSENAAAAALLAATGAVNLEFDLVGGSRGERDSWVDDDLLALTGAAAATVVNNNAAAVLLALNSLAQGKEVIVSRGELVEIGGSFRIPEIMAKSGAILREVGTTNRTHARDYLDAIGPRTGLLLKVHCSNYRVVGFTADVSLGDLCQIGREHGLPVMEDLGSGALVDLSRFGLPPEPVVRDRIALGADVVTFSGDKLLGGPQCGLIAGSREALDTIRRNPLKRALRCDKMTLAALSATLRHYRDAANLPRLLPTLRWLTRSIQEMEEVGSLAVTLLRQALGGRYSIDLCDAEAVVGSGAQPGAVLPSKAVVISHPGIAADAISRRFRRSSPPILGRVADQKFWLDLRGIHDANDIVPGGPAA